MAETHKFILSDLMSAGLKRIGRIGAGVFGNLDRMQSRLEKSTGRLSNTLGGLAAGTGIFMLGRSVVDTTGEFENMAAVLENDLGSASAAQKTLSIISEFAAKTPFQVDALRDSFVKLNGQGFRPSLMQMTKLGDLATSKAKSFNQLTEALIDAEVGEFERLKEFGIRAKKNGDLITFSFKGVQKQVQFNETAIREYILSLGDLQGVQGSMAAISQTMAGQMSNLGDRATSLKLAIGQNLRPVIMSTIGTIGSLIDGAKSAVMWLGKNTAVAKGLASGLGLVASVLGIVKIATIAWNIALMANPISIIVVAIGALVGALVFAWNKFEGFRGFMVGLWASLKEIFTQMKENIINTFGGLGNLIAGIFTFDLSQIKKGIAQIGSTFNIKDSARRIAEAYKQGDAEGRAQGKLSNPLSSFSKGFGSSGGLGGGNDSSLGSTGNTGNTGLTAGIAGVESRNTAPKQFILNIDKLVETIQIHSTTVRQGADDIAEEVQEALMKALRDFQLNAG
ncbi:MAG: hypothetical protein AAF587_29640 [Bacteroidota bacterium]